MLSKLLGIILVTIGLAGLILPVIPGVLLIILGLLLLFNDRLHELRKYLPEEIPPAGAVFYNAVVTKIFAPYYENVAAALPVGPGQTIVDVGTGPGSLPIAIKRRYPAAHIIGIDISPKMIEIAQVNARAAFAGSPPQDLEFKAENAGKLSYTDNSIDIFVSTGSYHHWKEPVVIMDELYRCLKPGGKAYIYDGYGDADIEAVRRSTGKVFLSFPTAGFVRNILKIHGFRKCEYETKVASDIASTRFHTALFSVVDIMMCITLTKGA